MTETFKKIKTVEMSEEEEEIVTAFRQKKEFWDELVRLKKMGRFKCLQIVINVNRGEKLDGCKIDNYF